MAVRHLVLVAEQQEEFEAVVSAVREQGFVVEEVIEEIATLVGSVVQLKTKNWTVFGTSRVSSVEQEKRVQLPSPESDGPF